jgi:hypothetical protein
MRRQLHLENKKGKLTARPFHQAGGLRFLEDGIQIFPRIRKKSGPSMVGTNPEGEGSFRA